MGVGVGVIKTVPLKRQPEKHEFSLIKLVKSESLNVKGVLSEQLLSLFKSSNMTLSTKTEVEHCHQLEVFCFGHRRRKRATGTHLLSLPLIIMN